MNKLIIAVLILIVILPIVNAQVKDKDIEKTGKSLGKDVVITEMLKQSNITDSIGKSVNETNPVLYQDVQSVCKKTVELRNLIFIMLILSLIGLITIPPAGVIGLVVTAFIFLSYICLI